MEKDFFCLFQLFFSFLSCLHFFTKVTGAERIWRITIFFPVFLSIPQVLLTRCRVKILCIMPIYIAVEVFGFWFGKFCVREFPFKNMNIALFVLILTIDIFQKSLKEQISLDVVLVSLFIVGFEPHRAVFLKFLVTNGVHTVKSLGENLETKTVTLMWRNCKLFTMLQFQGFS